jgi:hypothetical protein
MNTSTLKMVVCAVLTALGGAALASEVESVSPQQLEQQRAERTAQRAVLDATMRKQGRDAEWASAVEQQIRASLGTVAGLDATARSVECAATLCRVILDHATLSAQQDVLNSTAGLPGFDLPGQAHLEWSDDGSAVTYIYLQRYDTDWPEVLTP